MGNVHLVTGYRGENHVTASDMGILYVGIVGTGDYALKDLYDRLSATIVTNNRVDLSTGQILMQGRFVRIPYMALTIENGTQGYNRIDTIACEFRLDESTGIEDANVVVVKGTPTTGTPTAPEMWYGEINYGDSSHRTALFNVHISGISISKIEQVIPALETPLAEIAAAVSDAVPVTRKIAGIDLSKDISALNLLAALTHTHAASEINSGTLSADRLPTVPIAKGGTGATNGATGLKNLFAAGATVLSSHQYGDTLPSAGTAGRIFFKKV